MGARSPVSWDTWPAGKHILASYQMTVRLTSLRWLRSAAACAFSDAFRPFSMSFRRSGWFKMNSLADALKNSLSRFIVPPWSLGWQISSDLNHKAMATMADITPAVLMANEVAAAWPPDRSLEFIHVPFAAAQEPPTFDPSFYDPLTQLDIPDSVRFVAGCIHESLSAEQQVDLLRLIESRVGREVDVAAACGLGRRPDVSQAWDAMEKALLLVQAAPDPR